MELLYHFILVTFYLKKIFIKKILYSLWKKKYFRADHAHKKCTQIIIPIRGKVKLLIKSKNYNKIFELTVIKKRAVVIPPFNWVKIFLIIPMIQS